ncbi:cation diffusion facilitator family transporter [Erythrobacteraceae bacterium CFH 75059]|uniref:cation diffusion facilitator family transporter n=1 Tax=Qipengyuania thermophila TaxID=2509361 RepID=UPI001020B650|nr:cation diffusion facilitator family transporter [Qipengyuania thermophila]TCD06733.1 cation diffusion facilitator family transporter [Erythrobacteraceae bacterium CFH 75059]
MKSAASFVQDDRSRLARGAALASISVAAVLVALKTWAAWRTGSSAMLGSLADSALDLVASLTTFFGVWIAAFPADREHRFGHGKAEAVAAMVQAMLIGVSIVLILLHSVRQLTHGVGVRAPLEGMGVSLVAIALTLGLLSWQRYVLRRTGSVAIRADHLHYQSDMLLNLAVIAALVLEGFAGLTGADPVFGFLIAGWLGYGAFRAAGDAIDQLMDHEWPEDRRQRLVELVAQHPELSNLHDLRTRTSGHRDFVQFHIDMDPRLSVVEAHDIIERMEKNLCRHFPRMELFVHIDPAGYKDSDNPLIEENEFARLGPRP